jgi:hypothetical protein
MMPELSIDKSLRIIKAIKELHEAMYDVWSNDDSMAFTNVLAALREMEDRTIRGQGIAGWSGFPDMQLDTLQMLQTLQAGTYGLESPRTTH